jgi:hypothetical protein
MNHKPWHWRKKSMEKTSFSADKIVSPSQIIDKEVLGAFFTNFYITTYSLIPLLFCESETIKPSSFARFWKSVNQL